MTLITNQFSDKWTLQVSDRLVIVPNCEGEFTPYDSQSNKTIVLEAADAIVSISYYGVAYLEGKPTDSWLAEVLIGEPIASDGVYCSAQRLKPIDSQRLDGVLLTLLRRLEGVVPWYLTIGLSIVGWQWNGKDRSQAIHIGIHLYKKRWERKFRFNKFPIEQNGVPVCSIVPGSYKCINSSITVQGALVSRKSGNRIIDSFQFQNEHFKQVRDFSNRYKGIGRNCVGVVIYHPYKERISVTCSPDYVPYNDEEPSVFTPWLIGPRGWSVPADISVGVVDMSFSTGGFRITVGDTVPFHVKAGRATREVKRSRRKPDPSVYIPSEGMVPKFIRLFKRKDNSAHAAKLKQSPLLLRGDMKMSVGGDLRYMHLNRPVENEEIQHRLLECFESFNILYNDSKMHEIWSKLFEKERVSKPLDGVEVEKQFHEMMKNVGPVLALGRVDTHVMRQDSLFDVLGAVRFEKGVYAEHFLMHADEEIAAIVSCTIRSHRTADASSPSR